MAKLDELWDPVPRRLIADMRSEKWTAERPAPDLVGWLWAFRQMDDGSMPSTRDLTTYTAWGNRKAGRVLNEAMESWKMWSGKHAERQAPHGATKRITSAPPAHHLCTTPAPPAHLSESVVVDTVEDERITSAPPAHHLCTTPAPPAHRRARSFLRKESDTTVQGEESGSPDLVPSPPPAEPSGSPADLWSKAADLAEGAGLSEMETPTADPEAWRAFEEFQPSSDAYVFDDAEPVAVIEQPSDPRQIESPDHDSFDPASMVLPRTVGANPQRYTLHAVNADAKATPDVASTSPAQPFDPIEEFATPSPPPSASPAARPRGLSSEGAPEPVAPPQSAPSLFGRTDAAPMPSEPAKAPPRARKATAANKAADALAVYAAWRVYHPRAAETPTPDTLRTLGRILTEAGGLDGALLLMEWVHLGTCERARQLRGEAPWPDGRRTVYTDLGSLSRHVAGRLEMARSWKEGATDKDSGLNVINLQPHTYRGPPNRTTRDIDFYKALELI
jgi:hypothetical protein